MVSIDGYLQLGGKFYQQSVNLCALLMVISVVQNRINRDT